MTSSYLSKLETGVFDQSLSHELYKVLVPEKIDSKNIKIVPDGILNYLPFEALISDDREGLFLVQSYDFSYTVSLSLDKQWSNGRNRKADLFNVISPIYDLSGYERNIASSKSGSDNYEFRHLKYTTEEVEELASAYTSSVIRDSGIDKEDFISALNSADVFHFTGHAVLDPEEYGFSFLVLGDDGNELDNVVTLSEINETATNAQLVMLNACNTGNGKILKGEGVFSLARAFFRAGAKSVVNALWEIDDQSSMHITLAFYKYLKKGHTKSSALRQAKLDYLNSDIPEYKKHPYYWAGLVLVGNDAPLCFGHWYDNLYWLPWTSLLILIGFFLIRWQRGRI